MLDVTPGVAEPAAPATTTDPYARRLRASVLGLLAIVVLVAAFISAVPGLDEVSDPLSPASATWLRRAIGFEYLSCTGYVLTILLAFPRGRTRPTARLAWAELAANAVL